MVQFPHIRDDHSFRCHHPVSLNGAAPVRVDIGHPGVFKAATSVFGECGSERHSTPPQNSSPSWKVRARFPAPTGRLGEQ